jgi:hypothetical protein
MGSIEKARMDDVAKLNRLIQSAYQGDEAKKLILKVIVNKQTGIC